MRGAAAYSHFTLDGDYHSFRDLGEQNAFADGWNAAHRNGLDAKALGQRRIAGRPLIVHSGNMFRADRSPKAAALTDLFLAAFELLNVLTLKGSHRYKFPNGDVIIFTSAAELAAFRRGRAAFQRAQMIFSGSRLATEAEALLATRGLYEVPLFPSPRHLRRNGPTPLI